MEALSLENIEYTYKNGQQVLKGINVKFERGKIYAIIGPSGCGKTTLLSLIGGLDEPTAGMITSNGKNIALNGLTYYRRHQVAFVFQNFNLIDYLTAAENLNLITKQKPYPMLEKVGLTKEQSERSILQLSGGQQQRVAIARALISEADVILADEPTGNLDEETADGITTLLLDAAHERNKCVIIVTHSQELAKRVDITYCLKNGLLEKWEENSSEKKESVTEVAKGDILPTGL